MILVDSSRNLSQAGLCSATVNVAVTEQRLEEGSDAHRAKLYTIETAHAPFFAVKGGDIIKRSVDSKRADPQQLKVILRQNAAPVDIQRIRADFVGGGGGGGLGRGMGEVGDPVITREKLAHKPRVF